MTPREPDAPSSVRAPATLVDLLTRAAAERPSHGITYVDAGGATSSCSWPALVAEAQRVAAGLALAGVERRRPVIVATDDAPSTLRAVWGSLWAGSVPLVVQAPIHPEDLAAARLRRAWLELQQPLVVGPAETLMRTLGDRARVASATQIERGGTATPTPSVGAHEAALLVLTSGSEGHPKIVAHTHEGVLAALAGSAQATRLDARDVSLNWLPLHHVGGLFRALRDVWLGARSLQVATAAVAAEPRLWMELTERHAVTSTWGPNFALGLLAERMRASPRLDLSGLRSLLTTGEVVVPATLRRLLAALTPHGFAPGSLHATWGMTEAWSATLSRDVVARLRDGAPAEAGPAVPGVALRIVGDDGGVLPDGQSGHLEVRGPACAAGYWRDGRIDRSGFDADGWLRTGDLGVLRAGRLTVTGRESDSVVVNGLPYSCHELEDVLTRVPGIDEGRAIVCPLRTGGDTEQVAVVVRGVLTPGLTSAIRERLALAAGLSGVHVISLADHEVPRTSLGKLRRADLARRVRDIGGGEAPSHAAAPPAGASSASAETARIAAVLAGILGRDQVAPDDNIFALGAGSLHVLRAVVALQGLGLGRPVTPLDLFAHATPRRLAARLLGGGDERGAAEEGAARGRARLARRGDGVSRRRIRHNAGSRA